ncbi:MAG: type II toxin-antitoxin system RelE/ParE family toxin [Bryobacteraceae bacterium]
MKRFVLSPDAAQDLDDIWEYIAEDGLDAADRLIGELYDQILALAAMGLKTAFPRATCPDSGNVLG